MAGSATAGSVFSGVFDTPATFNIIHNSLRLEAMSTVITDQQAMSSLAANLKQLLAIREMSQAQLARVIGASPMRVSTYVNGTRMPGVGVLARIAEALDTTMDDLIRSPEKNSRKSA